MIENAVVALRLSQYLAGSILFGSALFLVYALPREHQAPVWARPLLVGGSLLLGVSALLGYVAQTITMAGSVELGLARDSLEAMASTTLGKAAFVRAAAAFLALPFLLFMRRGPALWLVASASGSVAVAGFGWMGHAAASEGSGADLHLYSDILHALLAGIWIGALIGFGFVVLGRRNAGSLHFALTRFSSIGVALVVLLTLTGLVNSWFLVGLGQLGALFTTAYGRMLTLKLGLFALMLLLAGANRWLHTDAVGRDGKPTLALQASLVIEAALGVAILALVAWFGMMEPPSSLQ